MFIEPWPITNLLLQDIPMLLNHFLRPSLSLALLISALSLCTSGCQSGPESYDSERLRLEASSATRSRDYAMAARCYTELLRRDKDDQVIEWALARATILDGQNYKMDNLVQNAPADPRPRLFRGRQFTDNQLFVLAQQDLDAVLQLPAVKTQYKLAALRLLAVNAFSQQQFEESKRLCLQAIDLGQTQFGHAVKVELAHIHFNLAQVYINELSVQEAYSHMSKFAVYAVDAQIELSKTDYLILAVLADLNHDKERASDYYRLTSNSRREEAQKTLYEFQLVEGMNKLVGLPQEASVQKSGELQVLWQRLNNTKKLIIIQQGQLKQQRQKAKTFELQRQKTQRSLNQEQGENKQEALTNELEDIREELRLNRIDIENTNNELQRLQQTLTEIQGEIASHSDLQADLQDSSTIARNQSAPSSSQLQRILHHKPYLKQLLRNILHHPQRKELHIRLWDRSPFA